MLAYTESRNAIMWNWRAGGKTSLPSSLIAMSSGLLFSVNHVFSGLTGRRTDEDFEEFALRFPAVETRNGAMLAQANRNAADFAQATRKAVVAGSDSHTLAGLAKTYTEVPGARTAKEYLEGLRRGHASVDGRVGQLFETDQSRVEYRPRHAGGTALDRGAGAIAGGRAAGDSGESADGNRVRHTLGKSGAALRRGTRSPAAYAVDYSPEA